MHWSMIIVQWISERYIELSKESVMNIIWMDLMILIGFLGMRSFKRERKRFMLIILRVMEITYGLRQKDITIQKCHRSPIIYDRKLWR